jgi:hypothetical protein
LGQEVGGLSPVDLEAVVRVTWEPVRGYAWIRYLEHIEVVDNQTLARWEAALRAQLDPILVGRGDKFPCVISIDNMSVRPVVADDYGEMAKRLVANYASRHARYGRPSTVRTIVAVEALKNGVPANLFESLEDAVVYVLGEN